MSDLITDAMVEAAARADHATYDAEADWDSIDDRTRDVWREGARAALEAAAPLIAPRAWEAGFDTGTTHGIAYQAGNNDALARPDNPYSADRIERGES